MTHTTSPWYNMNVNSIVPQKGFPVILVESANDVNRDNRYTSDEITNYPQIKIPKSLILDQIKYDSRTN